MSEQSSVDTRIQVLTQEHSMQSDDRTVLRVLREGLRKENPVVQFEARSPRRSLLLL